MTAAMPDPREELQRHRRGTGLSSYLCSYCCKHWPCPTVETATYGPPAPELTEAEKATVERFEAAEEPEEVVVEKVARALWVVPAASSWRSRRIFGDAGGYYALDADSARRIARAALTVLRGDRAPLAGQGATGEEGQA